MSKRRYLASFDVQTGKLIREFTNRMIFMTSTDPVCFSDDGKYALTGSYQGQIRLWNVSAGKCLYSFSSDLTPHSACFSPDGSTVLTGHTDGTIREWKIPEIIQYEYLLNRIHTSDALLAEQALFDNLKYRFNILMNEKNIDAALNIIKEMANLPILGKSEDYRDVKRLISAYCVKEGKIGYQVKNVIPMTIGNEFKPSRDLTKAIIVSKMEGNIKLIEVETGKLIDDFQDSSALVGSIILSAKINSDGSKIVTGTNMHEYIIWDVKTRKASSSTFADESNDHFYVDAISSDGNKAVLRNIDNMGQNRGIIFVVDLDTLEIMYSYYIDKGGIYFSPDCKKFLILDGNKITLADSASNEIIFDFIGHVNDVYWAGFSADGKYILSHDNDYVIKLWDVETGNCLHTLKGMSPSGSNNSFHIAFCAGDTKIIAYSLFRENHTICIWDTITGILYSMLEFENEEAYCVNISSDGQTLFVAGECSIQHKRLIRAWNTKTNQCVLAELSGIDVHIGTQDIYFNSDDWKILCVSLDKAVLYDLDYDLTFPGWKNWDEGARPYLEIFLTLHPNYTEEDFNNILIPDLQNRGYGWLRPEGVRIKLDELQFGW